MIYKSKDNRKGSKLKGRIIIIPKGYVYQQVGCITLCEPVSVYLKNRKNAL